MTMGDRSRDQNLLEGAGGPAATPPGKPVRSFATWMGAAYVGQSRWPPIIGGGVVVLAAIAFALWLVS
jgi:hypothetical protein